MYPFSRLYFFALELCIRPRLQICRVRKCYSVVKALPEIDHLILTCERVCHGHIRSLS